jgi:hypothetical protein
MRPCAPTWRVPLGVFFFFRARRQGNTEPNTGTAGGAGFGGDSALGGGESTLFGGANGNGSVASGGVTGGGNGGGGGGGVKNDGGLVLFWSLRNPQFPEKVAATPPAEPGLYMSLATCTCMRLMSHGAYGSWCAR